MMNSRTPAVVMLGFAAFGAVGCGSIAANPIEKRSPGELTSASESDDPYACEVIATGDGVARSWVEEYSIVCKSADVPCSAGGYGQYHLEPQTGVVTGYQELAMACEHPCRIDSDCPAPASGTGVASCFIHPANPTPDPAGVCIVRCDGGRTCQDGFACSDNGSCVSEPYTFSVSYVLEAP